MTTEEQLNEWLKKTNPHQIVFRKREMIAFANHCMGIAEGQMPAHQSYTAASYSEIKIGIAITTTPDREKIHIEQLEAFNKFLPKDAVIVVYNDWEYAGIAKAKNACISRLMEMGCTHLFLFDDDVYPIENEWWLPFIKSGLQHACPTFTHLANGTPNGHRLLSSENGISTYSSACGMILYYTRECIERVGGMDVRYGRWGYEHTGLSIRIRNAGLTRSPFISPTDALDYFYCYDYEKSGHSLLTSEEKSAAIKRNEPIFKEEQLQTSWKPYGSNDYVLTAFYTKHADPQRRNARMPADTKLLEPLINSAPCDVVCFTDMGCPHKPRFKYVSSVPPKDVLMYNYRFIEWYLWIKRNLEYCDKVYLLDATDTEFIGKPHRIVRGSVYVNTEKYRADEWLLQNSAGFTTEQRGVMTGELNPFWNCGVIYGYADDVLKLLEAMIPFLRRLTLADMAAINYVANRGVPGIDIVPVDSGFKQSDKTGVYIRHK